MTVKENAAPGTENLCVTFLWVFFKQIILQVVFRQNSNASQLCPVARDGSFVSFLSINELYKKKTRLLQT